MKAYDRLEITIGRDLLINGDPPVTDLQLDQAEARFLDNWEAPSMCEYCGAPIQEQFWGREVDENWEIWDGNKWAILINCENCRFWEWYRRDCIPSNLGHPDENHLQCASKLRAFEGDLPDVINWELAQYLRRRPNAWCRFTPAGLEQVVADILRANYREAEVIHVGRPGDGGVDVLLIDSGGPTWLVQVKRRSKPESVESVETLRNLLGAIVLHGTLHGLVVSTADRFSTRTRAAVTTARQFGYEIRLADRGVLERMLDPVLPELAWLDVMKHLDPEAAAGFAPDQVELPPSGRDTSYVGAQLSLWDSDNAVVPTERSVLGRST